MKTKKFKVSEEDYNSLQTVLFFSEKSKLDLLYIYNYMETVQSEVLDFRLNEYLYNNIIKEMLFYTLVGYYCNLTRIIIYNLALNDSTKEVQINYEMA